MLIFNIAVDYGLSAQNLPADDNDFYASNYPLKEQKRSV